MIETVDSFQGKQLDVIIFSCVRAKGGNGLGFITDVRRLNVAITRAKRALWILGSLSKLQADSTWRALIEYVCLSWGIVGFRPANQWVVRPTASFLSSCF